MQQAEDQPPARRELARLQLAGFPVDADLLRIGAKERVGPSERIECAVAQLAVVALSLLRPAGERFRKHTRFDRPVRRLSHDPIRNQAALGIEGYAFAGVEFLDAPQILAVAFVVAQVDRVARSAKDEKPSGRPFEPGGGVDVLARDGHPNAEVDVDAASVERLERRLTRQDFCLVRDVEVVGEHLGRVVLGTTVDEGAQPRRQPVGQESPHRVAVVEPALERRVCQKTHAQLVDPMRRPRAREVLATLKRQANQALAHASVCRNREYEAERHRHGDPVLKRARHAGFALRPEDPNQKEQREAEHPQEANRHERRHHAGEPEAQQHGIDAPETLRRAAEQEAPAAPEKRRNPPQHDRIGEQPGEP